MPRKPKGENLKNVEESKKAANARSEKNVKSKNKSTKTTNKKVVSSSNTKTKTSKKISVSKSTISTIKKTSKTPVKKVPVKKQVKKEVTSIEYYDLPYRYNQTTVKILAQTPKMLFIYWDISDKDRKNFAKKYGDTFFENTKPVLVIHNTTQNYSFEVDINDFANSWYLHINDTFCNYSIELGRRPISQEIKDEIKEDYIFVASSNVIEAPNDHILFDKQQQMVYFKNAKTNIITARSITSLYFLRNMGKIYNIYDLYKEIYKDEVILTNPSSGNPTSTNPTSTFK